MNGFAGFDRSDYPGKAVMDWLRANANLAWCAFYLAPAPSHQDQSWMNAPRSDLKGWGLAPVYVGQQITGPGSHIVNASQGALDGADVSRLMKIAGFSPNQVVYLDLENGPPMSASQSVYVAAWIDAVWSCGYQPGVYCSFLLAAQVKALRPVTRIWAFHVRTVLQHAVPGETFPTPDPTTSGFAGASIWQLDDEAEIACPAAHGGLVVVDLDSADSADPSAI